MKRIGPRISQNITVKQTIFHIRKLHVKNSRIQVTYNLHERSHIELRKVEFKKLNGLSFNFSTVPIRLAITPAKPVGGVLMIRFVYFYLE